MSKFDPHAIWFNTFFVITHTGKRSFTIFFNISSLRDCNGSLSMNWFLCSVGTFVKKAGSLNMKSATTQKLNIYQIIDYYYLKKR